MNKKLLTLLFVIVVTVTGLTAYALTKKDTVTMPTKPSSGTTEPTPSKPVQPDEQAGKIVCLPKKGNGPHTLECAMGLLTAEGKYYALKNAKLGSITTESNVAVKGKISQPPTDTTYDIAGEIDVTEIRELK